MFSCIVVQLNYSKVSVLSITALLLSIALLHWHWQNGSILPPHWENHYARCKVLENEVNCSANLPGLWSMEWENYQVTNLKNFQETVIKNSKHPEGEQSSTRKRKVWLLSDWLLFTYYSHWRLVKIHITLHKTLVLSGRKGRREDRGRRTKSEPLSFQASVWAQKASAVQISYDILATYSPSIFSAFRKKNVLYCHLLSLLSWVWINPPVSCLYLHQNSGKFSNKPHQKHNLKYGRNVSQNFGMLHELGGCDNHHR